MIFTIKFSFMKEENLRHKIMILYKTKLLFGTNLMFFRLQIT